MVSLRVHDGAAAWAWLWGGHDRQKKALLELHPELCRIHRQPQAGVREGF
jgi:hypothetical protein